MLFVLIVLAHDRRRVVYFNVTEHPTSEWTAQQLVEAFPWAPAPKYLLRDRDAVYGSQFRKRVRSLGMKERLTAPRSPWRWIHPMVDLSIHPNWARSSSSQRSMAYTIITFGKPHEYSRPTGEGG